MQPHLCGCSTHIRQKLSKIFVQKSEITDECATALLHRGLQLSAPVILYKIIFLKYDQAKSLVRRFTWIEENCRARKWALLNSLEIEDDSGSNLDQFGIKLVLFDLVFAFENNLIVSYPDATVLQGKIEHVIDEGLRLGVVARSPETLSEQLFDQRPMRSRVEMRIEYQQRTRRLEQI